MAKHSPRKIYPDMSSTRRSFLGQTTLGIAALGYNLPALAQSRGGKTWRAAVIGRTGGGDYGHGYDQIFAGLENVEVVAVADANPEGLKQAAERSKAKRTYGDFGEMLEREKPDLVSIAPRHPDCHKEMVLAAIEAGASGIFMEKPMTEIPAEADEILAAAEKKRVKICLAHNRRWTPGFVQVKPLLASGLIGAVREVRIQGKQDRRAGGEDMMVLGTHDFDLMRYYFGDPRWCFASVMVKGRDMTLVDAHKASEPILVAGDTIHAQFGFNENVVMHWSSVTTSDDWTTRAFNRGKWAFEIYGSKGIIGYQDGVGFMLLKSPFLMHKDDTRWQPLPNPGGPDGPEHARHPIRSLIHAIENDQQPICSGYDGRWAIEMVAAVYSSAVGKARVDLPLKSRSHPFKHS
jgi:predicted dehydrogenase